MRRYTRNSSRGQRKHRRNIFVRLRQLGYTTKAELEPFQEAIRLAVYHNQPFNFPESLILIQRRKIGEAKSVARAKARQATIEAEAKRQGQNAHQRRTVDRSQRWPSWLNSY